MSDYTPTTEQVRDAYVRALRNAFVAAAWEHEAEFDRWLDATIRQARAEERDAGRGYVDRICSDPDFDQEFAQLRAQMQRAEALADRWARYAPHYANVLRAALDSSGGAQ